MRTCTRPLLMHMHAHRCNEAVLTASNCRETVSLFANYTSSKGVSMETVETPVTKILERAKNGTGFQFFPAKFGTGKKIMA